MRKMGSAFILATTTLFAFAAILYAPSGLAHPPWNPYDQTVFAPIKAFGPRIKVETIVKEDPETPGAINLASPLKGVATPGLPNHLFVVDQPGRIVAVNLTTGDRVVFLDVGPAGLNLLVPLGVFFGTQVGPNGVSCAGQGMPESGPSFDERGLLGLAFHPNYASNGKFYTYTSEPVDGPPTFPTTLPGGSATADHQNAVSEWIASAPLNPAAPGIGARRVLMRVDWPQFNHDGGDLAFGPDGLLYISMGDGGGADDQDGQLFIVNGTCGDQAPMVGHGPNGNGQNLSVPLGKIHRIDVDSSFTQGKQYRIPRGNPFSGPGVVREIFALGFRNPYRMSFDRTAGTLFVGDVGQNDIEEINVVSTGSNHGWRLKEGTLCFNPGDFSADSGTASPCPAPLPGLTDPVAQYDTHHEGHSAIGGFVYRGSKLPTLVGRYIFGEFARVFKFPTGPHDYGRLLHIEGGAGQGLREIQEFQIQGGNAIDLAVLGFGEDAAGEVYVTGNVSGIPFGPSGVVVRLAPADD